MRKSDRLRRSSRTALWAAIAVVLAAAAAAFAAAPAFAGPADAQVQALMGSRAMTLQDRLRAQWLEHIFWSREMARYAVEGEPDGRAVAERRSREAAAAITALLTPYHGSDRTDNLRQLFDRYIDELEAYIDVAIDEGGTARNSPPLVAARKALLARADGLAGFVESMSPNIWPSTAEGTLGAQASYQMTDIKLLLTGHHAGEGATWDLLRQNSYAIAGAMALATIRQFPDEFIPELRGVGRALNQPAG